MILPSIDNIKQDTFEVQRYENSAHGYSWELWCMYISPPKDWWDAGDPSLPIRSVAGKLWEPSRPQIPGDTGAPGGGGRLGGTAWGRPAAYRSCFRTSGYLPIVVFLLRKDTAS